MVKKWKEPKCSSRDEWVNKMWYIHSIEFYSVNKINKVLTYATIVDEAQNICEKKVMKRTDIG